MLLISSLFIVNSTGETNLAEVSFTNRYRFHHKPLCYYIPDFKQLVLLIEIF